jgi:hypothetical protein
MRYAMIATEIKGQVHAVGTIDLDKKGFVFETKDSKLSRLLREVKRKGIFAKVGGGHKEGLYWDKDGFIKITEKEIAPLQNLLINNGYVWWEDRS